MIEEVRLYHTFGDTEGKLDVLRVECIKCERINVRFGQKRARAHQKYWKTFGWAPDQKSPIIAVSIWRIPEWKVSPAGSRRQHS